MGSYRDRKLTQLAGEHLVAAPLARRGWVPMVMPESWPGYDIMAQSAEGESLQVQVKTMRAKGKEIFAPEGACPYPVVYVRLWGADPEFFPVPGADLERIRDESDEQYLLEHPNVNQAPGAHPLMLHWADIEAYHDRWDLIMEVSDE